MGFPWVGILILLFYMYYNSFPASTIASVFDSSVRGHFHRLGCCTPKIQLQLNPVMMTPLQIPNHPKTVITPWISRYSYLREIFIPRPGYLDQYDSHALAIGWYDKSAGETQRIPKYVLPGINLSAIFFCYHDCQEAKTLTIIQRTIKRVGWYR